MRAATFSHSKWVQLQPSCFPGGFFFKKHFLYAEVWTLQSHNDTVTAAVGGDLCVLRMFLHPCTPLKVNFVLYQGQPETQEASVLFKNSSLEYFQKVWSLTSTFLF